MRNKEEEIVDLEVTTMELRSYALPEIVAMLINSTRPSPLQCARYATKLIRKHIEDNLYSSIINFQYGLDKS